MNKQTKECLTSKFFVIIVFISAVYLGKKYAVPKKQVDNIFDPIHIYLQYFNDLVNNDQ